MRPHVTRGWLVQKSRQSKLSWSSLCQPGMSFWQPSVSMVLKVSCHLLFLFEISSNGPPNFKSLVRWLVLTHSSGRQPILWWLPQQQQDHPRLWLQEQKGYQDVSLACPWQSHQGLGDSLVQDGCVPACWDPANFEKEPAGGEVWNLRIGLWPGLFFNFDHFPPNKGCFDRNHNYVYTSCTSSRCFGGWSGGSSPEQWASTSGSVSWTNPFVIHLFCSKSPIFSYA